MASPSRPDPLWLSVILPVYRGERWIMRTLNSLAIQADAGVEIVVIDSSPNSDTMALVEQFRDRLSLTILDPKGIDGCGPKMNHGVAHARASYISWLCQDDLWLPGRIEAIKNWIRSSPDAVLHLAPAAIIDRDDRWLGTWRCPLKAGPVNPALLMERLIVQNFVAAPSPVIRRSAWLECGGIDPDLWYTGDWDLWLKLSQIGGVIYHDELTAAFRIHGDSATSTGSRDAKDFIDQHRIVVERHIDRIAPKRRIPARRLADASVKVNAALAATANGDARSLRRAVRAVLGLGPIGAARYIHCSRVVERALPRLRAKWSGVL